MEKGLEGSHYTCFHWRVFFMYAFSLAAKGSRHFTRVFIGGKFVSTLSFSRKERGRFTRVFIVGIICQYAFIGPQGAASILHAFY